ncbi:hypothetical protein BFJ71_g16374 [Fusarium oxysporum]|nr:hypothetical protein BFJ71_g16374 [Fusarium oxysporum]
MDESEYTRRQYHSSSIDSLKATDNSELPYDFVRFLAAVKRFHVPILHITWQNHRKELGSGATSEIREARTSLNHSFAFKRIPDIEKREKRKETIYQQLITEMSILRHPAFRRHPNIVELQGICWDIGRIQNQHKIIKGPGISGGFSVWPTLVFETSEYGDLYRFSTSPIGRSLDVNQRLNICVAIGHTIAEMMSYRKTLIAPSETLLINILEVSRTVT